jgi:AcrR family transcriptional regulator
MDEAVKRPYRSTRRREQADQTRERILAAAARVFVEHGFEASTVNAIAAEADVSPETIYARFGNKRALLVEVVGRAARGPEASPIPEQEGPRAIAAETDQHEQVRLFAADVVRRLERVGPLLAVLAGAARSEPELTKVLKGIHSARRKNLRIFVNTLTANGALNVDADTATDTVWALASPELHQLLAGRRGWTRSRYCNWLAASLSATLLH